MHHSAISRTLIFAFFGSLISSTSQAKEKITITGSSTVAPLLSEIAKSFEKQNADFRIDVQSGGSSRGISDTRDGSANIGMVSRALKADETDLVSHPIALDAITMIVHKDNPIKELSLENIKKIYTGQIKNWKVLGGKDLPITVVSKAEGRSTLELFLSFFQLKPTELKASVIIGDNEQGIKTVSGNLGSIGYVSVGTAVFEARNGAKIKVLPMDGIEPNADTIRSGKFPMSRPLNLVTTKSVSPKLKAFLDFAQSDNVKSIVEGHYFVTLK